MRVGDQDASVFAGGRKRQGRQSGGQEEGTRTVVAPRRGPVVDAAAVAPVVAVIAAAALVAAVGVAPVPERAGRQGIEIKTKSARDIR